MIFVNIFFCFYSVLLSLSSSHFLCHFGRIFRFGSAKVFDLVVPIVDVDHYLILGMTAAMAWELPFEPVDLQEDLQEAYEEGHLPLLERSDNVTALSASSKKKSSSSSKKKKKKQPTTSTVSPAPSPTNFFDSPSNFNQHYDGVYSNHYNAYNDYRQPMNSIPTYSQPHPYYTNYKNDKSSSSPLLDRYYYNAANRSPYRPAVGAHRPPLPSYSNKLEHYLSYADKFFKEFDAQMNGGQATTTSATKTVTATKAKKTRIGANRKSDAKYERASLCAHFFYLFFFFFAFI